MLIINYQHIMTNYGSVHYFFLLSTISYHKLYNTIIPKLILKYGDG